MKQLSSLMIGVTIALISSVNTASARCEDGAAIGAGLGAITGILGKKNTGNTVGRAAIGGVLGYAVCNELQKQRQELNDDLGDSGVTVTNEGDHLLVNFPGGVTFASDSYQLLPGAQYAVEQIAQSLKKYPNTIVEVVGHTDSIGSQNYNQRLSALRSETVADELGDFGVPKTRIRAYGRGELEPIARNDMPEGRAQNRRVEILIIPKGEA